MPGSIGTSTPNFAEVMDGIDRVSDQYDGDIRRADLLRECADLIGAAATDTLDVCVDSASQQLQELASQEPRTISDNQLLKGILALNRLKPSWLRRPNEVDEEIVLSNFKALRPSVPMLVNDRPSGMIIAGIVTDQPIGVNLDPGRASYSLPSALISFSFKQVTGKMVDEPRISGPEIPMQLDHRRFAASAVGASSVQGYIDSLVFSVEPSACGHNPQTNLRELKWLLYSVGGLTLVGIELDIGALAEQIKLGEDHVAELQKKAARSRALYQQTGTPILFH